LKNARFVLRAFVMWINGSETVVRVGGEHPIKIVGYFRFIPEELNTIRDLPPRLLALIIAPLCLTFTRSA